MRLDFPDDPPAAFSQVRRFHVFALATVLLVVVSGQMMAGLDVADEGILTSDGAKWAARAAALVWVACTIFFSALNRELRRIERVMKLQPRSADLAVTRSLVVSQVLRTVNGPFFASLGLGLFVATGQVLDVYLGGALGVAFLILTWPTKDHWLRVFRLAAEQHPEVNASPW